jgi:hypothetical protein
MKTYPLSDILIVQILERAGVLDGKRFKQMLIDGAMLKVPGCGRAHYYRFCEIKNITPWEPTKRKEYRLKNEIRHQRARLKDLDRQLADGLKL